MHINWYSRLKARVLTREPYPKWTRRLPLMVLMPWRNLGTLGLRIGTDTHRLVYLDVFRATRLFGLFLATPWGAWHIWPFRLRIKRWA